MARKALSPSILSSEGLRRPLSAARKKVLPGAQQYHTLTPGFPLLEL